jgi:hypothetical protein
MRIGLSKLIADVNSVPGLLHYVDVDNAASVFRVEVCKMVSFCVYKDSCFKNQQKGRRVGTGASSRPTGIVDWETVQLAILRALDCTKRTHQQLMFQSSLLTKCSPGTALLSL